MTTQWYEIKLPNEHFVDWDECKKRINRESRKYDDKRLPVLYNHSKKLHNNEDYRVQIKAISLETLEIQ